MKKKEIILLLILIATAIIAVALTEAFGADNATKKQQELKEEIVIRSKE